MMTFQELNDNLGAEEIYSGTSVDSATQGALIEWLFDRYLSMLGNDTTNWLRKYRRNLNMYYPIYMDYLRIESVRSNFDPFITEFMERIHEDNGTSTNTGTSTKNGSGSNSSSDRTVTDNIQVRTPDLVTNGTTGNTRTDALATSNTNSQTGTEGSSSSDSATDVGKQRTINIAYPEANMSGIPTDIDVAPASIDYASSAVEGQSKNEHIGSSSNSTSRNLTTTDSGTQTGTVTDQGTNRVTEKGTESIDFDGTVVKSNSGSHMDTEQTVNNGQVINNSNSAETEQGRHESIAELLPKAVSAITATNSIKWLVGKMMNCFDNYAEI